MCVCLSRLPASAVAELLKLPLRQASSEEGAPTGAGEEASPEPETATGSAEAQGPADAPGPAPGGCCTVS